MSTKLTLTDSEWMSLIDNSRDGLPQCCANISTLRDDLISAARSGGSVHFFNQVKTHFGWCFPDHDITPLMAKVAEQLGIKVKYADHEPEVEL